MTIEFVTVNAETILNNLITQFETQLGVTLYQGDERRIFLEQQAVVLIALYNALNETGKENLLAYATGDGLDAIGERTDCSRIPATYATVVLRFTLAAAQAAEITIPLNTRATPDGELFFATTADLVIAAGDLTGDITARAVATGSEYNDFVAGQINQIVDPIAYVASVANTTTSAGGDEIEDDDHYRDRIRQSPTAFSTAGPTDAYTYWAKTADDDIGDVSVTSPSAGEVKITVLMADGSAPSQGVLDAVLAVCNDTRRRPLTDAVSAAAPTTVAYNITLTYYISQDNAANETAIRAAIEGTGGAVDQYKTWQDSKLGRAINPDYLRQLMLNAGANRITLTAPAYATVDADKVAAVGTVTVTYGGLE